MKEGRFRLLLLFVLPCLVGACGNHEPGPSFPHQILEFGGSDEGAAQRAYWAAPAGKKLPCLLFLPGERNLRSRDDFQALASVFVPRGYAVVSPAGIEATGREGAPTVARGPWKERIRDLARLLKHLRGEGRVDLRRLALVGAGDDRWLTAHLARRLRSAVQVVVLFGAAPSTMLEGLLAAEGSQAQGMARASAEERIRKLARGATAARPYEGATASWWSERLERALPLDLGKLSVPMLLVRGGRDAGGEGRAAFLRRSVKITGGASFEEAVVEKLDASWRDSEGRRSFEEACRAAFPFLWKHCGAPRLLEG